MAHIAGASLLDQLIERINNGIEVHQVTPGEVIETKQYTPPHFIERFFRKEMFLLHRFSETRIRDALRILTTVTKSTVEEIPQSGSVILTEPFPSLPVLLM